MGFSVAAAGVAKLLSFVGGLTVHSASMFTWKHVHLWFIGPYFQASVHAIAASEAEIPGRSNNFACCAIADLPFCLVHFTFSKVENAIRVTVLPFYLYAKEPCARCDVEPMECSAPHFPLIG